MSNTGTTNQLPPRTATSNRWPRKWATLGGRGTSSSTTTIPTNENSSKTNGHRCQSTSLFRKASTISRTNGTPLTSDENTNQSLKKSRSLMNVLRAKLNSPAVLRRFRSKSRESTKQTVTEINGHEQQEVKQPNNEQTTRKSRKRDPSPMRRLANHISQLTGHQRTASEERQRKKSPSKSITNDSHEETRKSPTPIHNKDEVEHINACYDEIRAKYFKNDNTNKRNVSNDDFLNNSQHSTIPLPPDDPLLQACKQTNIKLNCLLSGYNLTTSFTHHERSFGQNDLFKFHHYYDVGKRKYDWNFTNNNSRIFPSMRTRPISKSIDNFRPTNVQENQTLITLQKVNTVDNDPLVQAENHEDVPRILLLDDNELAIHEDKDLIESEQNTHQYSSNIPPSVPLDVKTLASTLSDENNTISNVQTVDEHDEEFERNFLRAVDRALGVVNKDKEQLTEPIYDIPREADESDMTLIEMTERALSSFNNLPIFTNDDENTEPVNPIDESLSNEQSSIVTNENPEETNNKDLIDEDISSVIDDLIRQTEELLVEESKNGQTFLAKLDDEEKTMKLKSDAYNNLLHSNDNRLTEDVCTDINAVIGEVNLLLRGKLKQFRGLCEANMKKSTITDQPIPLDSDLEGFWDITYPLINKVIEKFAKLDARKAKQWAPIEEYDPDDINNRPRVIDDRLKQLQPQQNKSSKIPTANGDLKKLIQERRKAAANTTNQNHDIEIFVAPK